MKRVITAAVIGLMLASCTTTGSSQKVDAAIQKSLPQICSALDQAYLTFSAVAATGSVKQKTIDKVQVSYSVAQPVCDNPANATAAVITSKVIVAAFVLKAALKEVGK